MAKAAKMGDYLRYAMFDKYFKKIGNCVGASTCPAGTGKDSAHYLMSWYYAWGGATDPNAGWSWRIGSSHNHFGYQNPMAAWALTNVTELQAAVADRRTRTGPTSFDRQLEFYQWLQSAEGAIAGGATNSWDGSYAQPPSGTPTFYGMFYDVDSRSTTTRRRNQWFGMQVWSMQRIAELLLRDRQRQGQGAARQVGAVGARQHHDRHRRRLRRSRPTLAWTRRADDLEPGQPGRQHRPARHGHQAAASDVGVAAAYARTLMYYAAKSGNAAAKTDGQGPDRRVCTPTATRKGVVDAGDPRATTSGSTTSTTPAPGRASTSRRAGPATMPNGDVIAAGQELPRHPVVLQATTRTGRRCSRYLNGGAAPTFNYHRFWAQADVAMAYADYGHLFPNG